jgi:pyruvate formate lyase activating enzyme
MATDLDQMTIKGKLFEKLDDNMVRCFACAHRCTIRPGKRGVCQMRFNLDGDLRVPWGYVAGAQTDPIEKKPFTHFLPGSDALTFGMLGCNFHCSFCQNWESSQTLRDPCTEESAQTIQRISPEKLVDFAVRSGAKIIASSYNEPLITSEWAMDIFQIGRKKDIRCVFVSNGFATPETLDFLHPNLDGLKVDLKSFQEKQYHAMGGKLQPVLDTIQKAHQIGLWVEVVTLVIPGFNDSDAELWDISRFLVSVSVDIPWHVTAFHPDYQMQDRDGTPASTLQRAAEIGQEAGLRYVYAGNLPGKVGSMEDTFCPSCQNRLIQRRGYTLLDYQITASSTCPKCGAIIAGVWTDQPDKVNLGGWGMPRRVV